MVLISGGGYTLGLDEALRPFFTRETKPDAAGAQRDETQHGAGHCTGQTVCGSAQLDAESWHSVAASYDGRSTRLFVNGRVVAHAAAEVETAGSERSFVIGNESGGGPGRSHGFTGRICRVRVWGRALDAIPSDGIPSDGIPSDGIPLPHASSADERRSGGDPGGDPGRDPGAAFLRIRREGVLADWFLADCSPAIDGSGDWVIPNHGTTERANTRLCLLNHNRTFTLTLTPPLYVALSTH